MSLQLHTVEVADGGSPLRNLDRLAFAQKFGITNPAGSGAGASVVVAVALGSVSDPLPPNGYGVIVQTNQSCFTFVSAKTGTGFNVTLTPVNGSTTLAAGLFDIIVIG